MNRQEEIAAAVLEERRLCVEWLMGEAAGLNENGRIDASRVLAAAADHIQSGQAEYLRARSAQPAPVAVPEPRACGDCKHWTAKTGWCRHLEATTDGVGCEGGFKRRQA